MTEVAVGRPVPESSPGVRPPSSVGRWRVLYAVSVLPDDPCQSHLDLALRAFRGLLALGPGVEVAVVFTGETPSHPLGERWRLTPDHRAALERRFEAAIPDRLRARLHVRLCGEGDEADGWRPVKAWVEDFGPDVVFCWLGLFSARGIRPWLHARFPVITIQFSEGNRDLGPCDGVVLIAPFVRFDGRSDLCQRFVPGPFVPDGREMVSPRTPETVSCDVVTPLRGSRLSTAMRAYPPATGRLLAHLMARLGFSWRLIGESDPESIRTSCPDLAGMADRGRLQFREPDPDLPRTLAQSRLLFFPPGIPWGGGAAFMALTEGLPVLAPAESDIANFVSPKHMYRDLREMTAMLKRLLGDEAFRLAWAVEQQDRLLRENTSEAYALNLLDFACEVRSRVGRRAGTRAGLSDKVEARPR